MRVRRSIENDLIKDLKIIEYISSQYPPWRRESIKIYPITFQKSNNSSEVNQKLSIEHMQCHKDTVKLYTDGSRSAYKVGCAVAADRYS